MHSGAIEMHHTGFEFERETHRQLQIVREDRGRKAVGRIVGVWGRTVRVYREIVGFTSCGFFTSNPGMSSNAVRRIGKHF